MGINLVKILSKLNLLETISPKYTLKEILKNIHFYFYLYKSIDIATGTKYILTIE